MANPKLIATDLSTYTFSTSGYGYAVVDGSVYWTVTNNLQDKLTDYEPDTTWYGISAHNWYITIDMGSSSALVRDTLVFDNTNFNTALTSNGQVIVSGADDSDFAASFSVANIDRADFPVSGATLVYTFAPANYRYWRFVFSTSPHMEEAVYPYPIIGNLFVAKALEFTTNYDFGYSRDNLEYVSSERIALDGRIRTSQNYLGRYIWELSFTNQNNTFKTNFDTFMKTVRGKLRPFYYVDSDSVVRYFNLIDDYNPVTVRRYNINDVVLKMKEHRATR